MQVFAYSVVLSMIFAMPKSPNFITLCYARKIQLIHFLLYILIRASNMLFGVLHSGSCEFSCFGSNPSSSSSKASPILVLQVL